MDMNLTKYFGTILTIVGSVGASLSIHPIALPLAFIGVLLFIQGSESKILKLTENRANSVENRILEVSKTLHNQLNNLEK